MNSQLNLVEFAKRERLVHAEDKRRNIHKEIEQIQAKLHKLQEDYVQADFAVRCLNKELHGEYD